MRIVEAVIGVNKDQRTKVVKKIEERLGPLEGKVIGVLGLSFKPNTSDVRESPALDIVRSLLEQGAWVKAYDPEGMNEFKRFINDQALSFCSNPYEVAKKAEALVVVTEWNEFRNLDFARLKKLLARPVVIDSRNIYEPERMAELGFEYVGVGRGTNRQSGSREQKR